MSFGRWAAVVAAQYSDFPLDHNDALGVPGL
jgi:hypothetical protein